VRELLGVQSGWDWLSRMNRFTPLSLSHSLRVTGGVAGREPCQKIVEAYYGAQRRSGEYRGCSAYRDFRELLEKEKSLDAVVVCTTDNLHAVVSAAAMKAHKHVFCQKPLTHTIYEARRIAEIARDTSVATQIAVANQASVDTRLLCEWIWSGAIGPVREVINWSSRPFWPQGLERPKKRNPYRRFGLGPLARSGSGATFQPCVPSLCLARMGGFWLWRSGRYGLLQFRHNLPRPEAGGTSEY